MIRTASSTRVLPTAPLLVKHRHSPEHSIRHTYAQWMRRFPRWVKAGFDEDFLLQHALPALRAMLADGCYLTAAQLAHIWATTVSAPQERSARTIAECTLVATDFLARLQLDYCTQPL